jgi:regulator of replication initiation timing
MSSKRFEKDHDDTDSSDIRAQLSRNGVDQDTQNQLLEMHSKNMSLANEIDALRQQLQKAKNVSRESVAQLKAVHSGSGRVVQSRILAEGQHLC